MPLCDKKNGTCVSHVLLFWSVHAIGPRKLSCSVLWFRHKPERGGGHKSYTLSHDLNQQVWSNLRPSFYRLLRAYKSSSSSQYVCRRRSPCPDTGQIEVSCWIFRLTSGSLQDLRDISCEKKSLLPCIHSGTPERNHPSVGQRSGEFIIWAAQDNKAACLHLWWKLHCTIRAHSFTQLKQTFCYATLT